MIPGVSCSSCILWDLVPTLRAKKDFRLGMCRAKSPVVVQIDGRLSTKWPITAEDSWCGEHAVADEPEA